MPLKLPNKLPAIDILKNENIFVMDDQRASSQDIRPLKIAILNLMPIKITTETDLIRLLSNTPLQLEITFMKLRSHTPKNTPVEHMRAFYTDFDSLRDQRFDGMIITGAPVEQFSFEDVSYWPEVSEIFEWCKTHVTSTLYICWAAFAGMYYHYGVNKFGTSAKVFGVYPHRVLDQSLPIFRGFDDIFYMPHSRHTECRTEDILCCPELKVIATSEKAGAVVSMARNGREFYITGHMEYSPYTLDGEYKRDLGKGLPITMPENYYMNNDPMEPPMVRWRAHANLFYHNWINYYVYQNTPFDISQIR